MKKLLLSIALLVPFCEARMRKQLSPELLVEQNKPLLNGFASVAYSTLPTVYNSFELAVRAIQNGVEGDFVECGVAGGTQIAAMAQANKVCRSNKVLHAFDSYEGIPLAGPKDESQPGIEGPIKHNVHADPEDLLVSSGVTVWSLDRVMNNIAHWNLADQAIKYHKGWFEHVLPDVEDTIDKIAVLRLDGDLYSSTKICLEYLYPKMADGGYVIIDDYALPGCRLAVEEYLEAHDLHPEIITIEGGLGPVYWQVNH